MKWLRKVTLLILYTLALNGCGVDTFVSQRPTIEQFVGKTPEQIYNQAEEARRYRNYNTAISSYRAFIALYSKHTKAELAYLELINCYAARGQFEDALHQIEIFKLIYPKSIYYDKLKRRKEMLQKKRNRDKRYHRLWSQDVKKQHGLFLNNIIQQADRMDFEGKHKLD